MTAITPNKEPTAPNTYLSLKSGTANKTGQRSQGSIYYRILTDEDHHQLYLVITDNDGSGYFSKEVVPFDKIEQCLQGIGLNTPFTSKQFKDVFVSQSANNAGFLAAALRAEQLLKPDPESIHRHFIQPKETWADWKAQQLEKIAQAQSYAPVLPKQRPSKVIHALPASDNTQQHEHDSITCDDAEGDEAEMALLQGGMSASDHSDFDDDSAEDAVILTPTDTQHARKHRIEKRQKSPLVGGQS